MKLSIVIPAYNEEKTIGEIIKKIDKLRLKELDKELIIVDDGSSDNTYKITKSLGKHIKSFVIIKHTTNLGKGSAVKTGINKAQGDIILIQDADLEYNTDDIPKLINPIIKNRADVVYGTRLRVKPEFYGRNKTPFLLHFFGNKFLSLLTTLFYGNKITDMETGYKVFRRKVLDGINIKSKSFNFEPEITAKILKKGYKILEIDIKTKPRSYSEGKKLHTIKDGTCALWALIKYRFVD